MTYKPDRPKFLYIQQALKKSSTQINIEQMKEAPNPTKSIEEQIQENLMDSGFPLELETCAQLENAGWSVMPNEYVVDEDEKQEYEIDIIAHKSNTSNKSDGIEFLSFFKLIVECKKSKKHPWVFFTTKRRTHEELSRLITHTRNFGTNKQFKLPDHQYYYDKDYLREHITYDKMKLFEWDAHAISYTQAFRDPNLESQIYRAVKKVLRVLRLIYQKENMKSRGRGFSQILLTTYLPVIVVEGNMYEATLTEKGLKVKKSNYLPLLCNLDDNLGRAIIVVVTKEALPEFIEKSLKDAKLLHDEFFKIPLTKE